MPNKNALAKLLFICPLLLLFTACSLFGASQLVKAPASKQTYTIAQVSAGIDTFDPALAHDPTSISAVRMLFTGLVALDNKLQIRPQIAQSWQQSSDGSTWTFYLKPGLKFSDGTPLSSKDVAYSIDRALQPATQSTVAPVYLSLIKDSDQLLAGRISTLLGDSLQTPNDTTLIIQTSKKAAYFLSMLTYTCSYVVEKKLVTTYGTAFTQHLAEGGETGPFKLAQYIPGQIATFVPNAYYDPQPQLQRVAFTFYHSPNDAYQAYLNGAVDTADVPITNIADAKKRNDFFQVPQLWTNYYTMNYLVKPFDNIHIRQAFALAIDKVAIAKQVWNNTVLPTNHIVPQGMTGYNAKLTGPDGTQNLTGNATLARALLTQGLKEEGYSNVSQLPPITLTYATHVSNFDQEVKMLQQTWQNVLTITVSLQGVDYNTLLDKVTAATNNANGLQFWGLAWVGEYPDPQDWLTLQFDRGAFDNTMNYGQNTSANAAKQQMIQQQLEAADADTQSDRRIQMYQQAEQQLVTDVAWLPMEQVTATFLRTPYIVGIVDNGQSLIPPDDWANIYRVTPPM
ncbi:MAG: peptide ABC transporter substrate-binding protein [Chloroflexi bacterium]|nr:peptide ABC transporter substrate-binding protein [Ktedonobacteraceae bacterium]MBV9020049.1 peptide ABC transporter substrate-binding protein [Ktedonobacteraceae bacterium]MBV9709053.1 peptide ABC transporter substrate-binding protein [Chloroflexota bacterium]